MVGQTEGYELLAVGVVLVVVVVVVTLHFLRSYRMRRLQEIQGSGPAAASDRAYNRIALARREADLLEAQGGDAERARQLIALANRSLETREFDRAYELAQSAHETLVQARREPRLPSARSGPPAVPAAGAPGAPLPTSRPAPAPASSPAAPAVPKNRAEAQFQLRLFEEDLVRAKKGTSGGQPSAEARDLFVQAHAAFSKGDYQEAFRLALRGRRRVGGTVEALGPSGPSTPPSASAGDGSADVARLAEEVAAAGRCAVCGHPTVPGDTFCRGCGAELGSASCPKCGTPRQAGDTFCGKCGERSD